MSCQNKKQLFYKKQLYELKEFFISKLGTQFAYPLYSYSPEVLKVRAQIVEWIIFICKNCQFKDETLFRCITLFDIYISKLKQDIKSIYQINLIAIACLSIATKEEEINCNYISFLTQNVLNTPMNTIYTTTDLINKEIDILKVLNFKTLYISVYDFNSIFLEFILLFFEKDNLLDIIREVNSVIAKEFVKNSFYINYSPLDISIKIINQTILSIENNGNSKRVSFCLSAFKEVFKFTKETNEEFHTQKESFNQF